MLDHASPTTWDPRADVQPGVLHRDVAGHVHHERSTVEARGGEPFEPAEFEDDPRAFGVTVEAGVQSILTLAGDVDLGSLALLGRATERAFESGPTTIVLDLDAVTFVDTTGIKALLQLSRRCRQSATTLQVVSVPDNVRRVLEMTQVSTVLLGPDR